MWLGGSSSGEDSTIINLNSTLKNGSSVNGNGVHLNGTMHSFRSQSAAPSRGKTPRPRQMILPSKPPPPGMTLPSRDPPPSMLPNGGMHSDSDDMKSTVTSGKASKLGKARARSLFDERIKYPMPPIPPSPAHAMMASGPGPFPFPVMTLKTKKGSVIVPAPPGKE